MTSTLRFPRLVLAGMLALGLMALACGDEGDPGNNALVPGQTDFSNAEPTSSSSQGYPGSYGADGSANGSSGKEGSATPPAAPPQGRNAEVEEADIYKVDNDRLFYLNTYRGFLIYDLKDPKHPKQVSRLPVYGYPIEMFIQSNTVYALIKDALYLTQVKGKLQFQRYNVSQLVAIDITDLSNPKVLQTVDITGELREGVSRKVQDTVYVVSYIPQSYYWGWQYSYNKSQAKEQAWVYSFNVANPKSLKLVQKMKVFEGGSYSSSTPGVYESRYFSSVAISATSNTLMVVENWYKYGSVYGSKYNCGSYQSLQEAIVSVIDISDPTGQISLYSKFETYGSLTDQFKQTYIYDKTTGKATYLGIFARQEWTSQNCKGSSVIQNNLESWDITNGKNPVKQDSLAFGKPNETVRGSVFDPDRSTAFAITARNIDPLYALSFKDPKKLVITSQVDGLSGDMNVFRFIESKKFLIGIGRDNTQACKGFTNNSTGWATNVAVSIIDVQDLSNIRLVERQCVSVKDASWISSSLNWNLDQGHKMIGMHSDGKTNVITVPVYYYTKSTGSDWSYYTYQTAVGVMSWDITKYNPKLPAPQTGILMSYGTIVHPRGEVKRSVVFTHKAEGKRMVLNLSDTHFSLVDDEDLFNPKTLAVVEVAGYRKQLFRFGSYMVEQVEDNPYSSYYYGSGYGGATQFRVKKLDGSKLEDATLVAEFHVGQVQRVTKFKNNLLLFRQVLEEPSKTGKNYYTYYVEVLVYDLSNPTKPVKKSTVKLPIQYLPYYYYYCGDVGYWGGYWFPYYYYSSYYNNNWTVTDSGLSFLVQQYDYSASGYTKKLVFLDLTNTAVPKVSELPLTNSSDWNFYSVVSSPDQANRVYLSYRVKVGQIQASGTTLNLFKYYAQKWDLVGGTWVKGQTINVPGTLIKTWKKSGQTMFLTYDFTYKKVNTNGYEHWTPGYRLNLLREISLWGQPAAELLDFHGFEDLYLADLVLDGDKLYVNGRPASYYYGYYYDSTAESGGGTVDPLKYSDQLQIFDLAGYKLKQAYAAPTGTAGVQLMGTYQGKLFVNLPSDGVLVVDAANPAKPDGQQFLRTLGYATHVEFSGNTAYIASGYFGVYQLDLLGTPAIPYL